MISVRDISASVGLVTLSYLAFKISQVIRLHFHSSQLWRYNHPRKNSNQVSKAWALVTGASDGIGKAFAHELCARNFSVVLHGRNKDKLEKVKTELENEFKADIRLLVLDAGRTSTADLEATVTKALKDINLTILINNVGGGMGDISTAFAPITQRSGEQLDTNINVNARFLAQLTRVVLPLLIRNSPGLLINVSSALEEIPAPYIAAYAAAKAYGSIFTRALKAEVAAEGHDVEVMSLLTGRVVTNGAGRNEKEVSWMMPSARTFAAASLNKVGCGQANVIPWFPHAVEIAMARLVFGLLPEGMKQKMLIKTAREEMRKVQKRA